MIEELAPNEIFVFGSNLAGRHGGGAARTAKESFGAVEGVGEGLTGQCYAFPTLDEAMKQLDHVELWDSKRAFMRCARAHPGMKFLLTKVGCGIAGYPESLMIELFRLVPGNVVKPEGWETT